MAATITSRLRPVVGSLSLIFVPTFALKFGGPPEPCRNVDSTMIRLGFFRTARQAAASVR